MTTITQISSERYQVTHPDSDASVFATTSTVSDRLNFVPIDLKQYSSKYFGLNSEELLEFHEELILKAIHFEDKIRRLAQNSKLYWSKPLVNTSEDNFIVFEWWFSSRKITVYVSSNSIEVIKVWGADIDSEMEDFSINLENSSEILSVWNWLVFS